MTLHSWLDSRRTGENGCGEDEHCIDSHPDLEPSPCARPADRAEHARDAEDLVERQDGKGAQEERGVDEHRNELQRPQDGWIDVRSGAEGRGVVGCGLETVAYGMSIFYEQHDRERPTLRLVRRSEAKGTLTL